MKRIALVALLSLALVGCITPSVYPFYTDKDVVSDEKLIGTWGKNDASKETWTFVKDGDKAYTLAIIESSGTNMISAHLFKLDDHLFMDFLVFKDDATEIPPHWLMKVDQIRPTLKLEGMNAEWVQDYLDKNPGALRHILAPNKSGDTNQHVVLTADTKDLQKFVLKHMNEPKFFLEASEMPALENK
jgi:hypothetical protein